MSHIVTATIKPKSSLRVEKVIPRRSLTIGSGFSGPDKRRFFFIDNQHTREEIDLVIEDSKEFNLDDPTDKHNWKTLQAFCMINKDLSREIQLTDALAETEKAIKFADSVFEIEQFLRSKKHDAVLMSKLYRRLIGLASGLAEATIFRGLLELSKEHPQKFIRSGKIIADHEEFEMLALMDVSIERGFMIKDLDGAIKRSDGSMFATNINKAAFLLVQDDNTRSYLQRAVEDKIEKADEKYVFDIEDDSEYVFLAQEVGSSDGLSEGLLDIKEEKEKKDTPDSSDEIDLNLTKFIKSGFVDKVGAGPSTRYVLSEISDQKFTRAELINHFVLNYAQYDNLKDMSSI